MERPMAESRWSYVACDDGSADVYLHDETSTPPRSRMLLRVTGPTGSATARELVIKRNTDLGVTDRAPDDPQGTSPPSVCSG